MDANCQNCGAPITGPYCEYCGTRTVAPSDGAESYTVFYADNAPCLIVRDTVGDEVRDLFVRGAMRGFLHG